MTNWCNHWPVSIEMEPRKNMGKAREELNGLI